MNERKRQQVMILLPVLVCFICMAGISAFWMHEYRLAAFGQVSRFCESILETNPEAETMLLSGLKKYVKHPWKEDDDSQFLAQYGYRGSDFSGEIPKKLILLTAVLLFVTITAFLVSIRCLLRRSRRRIAGLTDYLEQINIGAPGTVMQTEEDEFSHLQDEMYKTVTALYQTRDEAVKARAAFADNLANIAHQLKTPVTASFLSLQLMEKTYPNRYARQIAGQLERLNRLEDSLLTLSRIDAGALQLEHSRVDVYTVLSLGAENLEDMLAKENISVLIPEKGCVEIDGDLEWTMEAVINLMKNCMEHSPEGGTIHCDYSQNPLYVEIFIWDEGKGFAAEDIPHLFERFYRGKDAAGNGIGIGLSLARSIFELQNGSITACNQPEGGACFKIRIYPRKAGCDEF